jgi:hypothetical protein
VKIKKNLCISILVFVFLSFVSCASFQSPVESFSSNEAMRIENALRQIMDFYKVENYEVLVFSRMDFRRSVISEMLREDYFPVQSSVLLEGSSIRIESTEADETLEGITPPVYEDLYEPIPSNLELEEVRNYSDDPPGEQFKGFSILIVLYDLDDERTEKIEIAVRELILVPERGDRFVLSRM